MKKQSVLSPLSGSILMIFFSIFLFGICQSQETIGFVRMQGNNGTLNLPVISETDAISLGNGVVKIALDNGLNGAAWLVSTTDPDGSEVRIQTPYGTRSWKKESSYAKTYGGIDYENAQSLVITNDGSLALAGYTESYGAGLKDMLFLKLHENGYVDWGKAYGYTNNDNANAMQSTSDGGYILFGSSNSGSSGSYDLNYKKIDSNGNIEWGKWVGTVQDDAGYDIVEDTDGGFVTTGLSNGMGAGSYDVWTRKVDALGNTDWGYTYGGTSYDVGKAIIMNDQGGYAVAGITSSFGAGSDDVYFMILDSGGGVENMWSIGGTERDGAYDVILAGNGDYVIAGYTASIGAGSDDFYVKRLDANGNSVWGYAYGGTDFERAHSIVETKDNGFVISGETMSFGAGNKDMWVIKIDSLGILQWTWAVGGSQYESGYSVVEAGNGNIYVAGYINSVGAGDYDIFLVKFYSDGSSCLVSDSKMDGISAEKIFNVQQTLQESDFQTIAVKGIRTPETDIKSGGNQWDDVTPVTPTVTTICD